MLNCVYHFNGEMRVVDNHDRELMLTEGSWFDSPDEANAYRDELLKMEEEPKEQKKRKSNKEII